MINVKNFLLVKEYIDYRKAVDQICEGSAQKEYVHLVYLLNWADETLFSKVIGLRPTFPDFLKKRGWENSEVQIQPEYMKKILSDSRRFFSWLSENKIGFKSIRNKYIQSLKLKRLNSIPKIQEAVTFEEIKAIASAGASNIEERRIRAGAVLLFLSGMRIGAFVSLPLQAIEIENRKIIQYPNLGVRTKNRKFGITFLLDIPELLKVIKEWDEEIRKILPANGLWFAPIDPKSGKIDLTKTEVGENRKSIFTKNLKKWLDKNGLPYHSPHKFRHGFTHYCLSQAKTIEDYKAISMNLMHSSMEITDQYYSNLNDETVKERIGRLGKNKQESNDTNSSLIEEFTEFLLNREKQKRIN